MITLTPRNHHHHHHHHHHTQSSTQSQVIIRRSTALVSIASVLLLAAIILVVSSSSPTFDNNSKNSNEDSQTLRNNQHNNNSNGEPVLWGESIHEYRSRMGMDTLDYQPNFVKEDSCRFLKQEECQAMDKATERTALHTRAVVSETHQLKTLVVLIQWENHANRELIPVEHIDLLWNADDIDATLYPSGSIKDYIATNSYHNLNIQADVMDWRMTNGTEHYYGDGRMGFDQTDTEPQLREAFHYVLDQMEAEGFPWEEYDTDGDLEIDSIMFMHSGYDAADGVIDCQTQTTWENRIWSHATGNWRQDPWTSPSTGIRLGGYAITSVFRGACDAKIVRIGILAHEYLHTLGLPDLYDYNGRYQGNGVGGLGAYDVMSNPAGPGNRPKFPGMLSPWSKLDMGWIQPIEITESGTYTARPSELYPDIYIIRQGYAENEYLMIENRQPISYDERMKGQGILIYHIDATSPIRGNSDRGFPGQSGWPGNGNHYPVALLQADGLYHIEKTIRDHDAGDFFHSQHILGPGNGESEASNQGVYPNSDSYVNGDIVVTGIVIDHFQEMEGGVWSFRVTFPEPTDAPTGAPTDEACQQIFEMQLRTDFYPRETSWELTDSQGNVIAQDGDWSNDASQQQFEHSTVYEEWICLEDKDETYTFTVFDYYGDGMCDNVQCRGWWKLWLNEALVEEGDGNFEFSATSTFETRMDESS